MTLSSFPSWRPLALCLALLGYGLFTAWHASPVAAGSDSAGYLMSARLLTEGRVSTPLRTVAEFPPTEAWEYTPLGMIYAADAHALIPTYPIGLPLLLAAASTVAGWHWGTLLVSVALACGAVGCTHWCAREVGVRPGVAGVIAAALAVCPLVFYSSLQPLTDTASACFCALTIASALRANRTRGAIWSVLAGAGLALAVLVRPSNLLLAPAFGVALGRPRTILLACLGGLPGALLLAGYHQVLYGSVFRTGYGSVWDIFSPAYVLPALRKYAIWVPAFLPAAVVGIVALPWLRWRERGREIAALGLWVVSFFAFYAFYLPTHENRWYLRFVLPAFPALLVLAGLALEAMLCARSRCPRVIVARGALGVVVVVSLATGVHHWRSGRLGLLKESAAVYRELPEWADAALPRDAFILTLYPSCSFYFYTDRAVIRSDILKPDRFSVLIQTAREHRRAIYAILTRSDDEPAMLQRLPGPWVMERRFGEFGVWRLADDQVSATPAGG